MSEPQKKPEGQKSESRPARTEAPEDELSRRIEKIRVRFRPFFLTDSLGRRRCRQEDLL